jgi:hypothetical protein
MNYVRIFGLMFCLVLAVHTEDLLAAEVTVNAEFKGDITGANQQRLTDVTPCKDTFCSYIQSYSGYKAITVDSFINHRFIRNNNHPRNNLYFKFPSARKVMLQHESGRQTEVTFKIRRIGGTFVSRGGQGSLYSMIGSPGSGIMAGINNGTCSRVVAGTTSRGNITSFLWDINSPYDNIGGNCYRLFTNSDRLPNTQSFTIEQTQIAFVYELRNDSPIQLENGKYSGQLVFSVGTGADFDMGEGDYADPQLIVNINLNVEHQTMLRFPANSDQVVLAPAKGWQEYLATGRVTEPVKADIPFQIWSTGPLSIYLRCSVGMDPYCGIRNANTRHQITVMTSITMPQSMKAPNNLAAERIRLYAMRAAQVRFTPDNRITNSTGTVHFEVSPSDVTSALRRAPGGLYTGTVTLMIEPRL